MNYGAVKIEIGRLSPCAKTGDVKMPVSAKSSDTNALILFQRLLERNPDFNSNPDLYDGKITSPQKDVYELAFTVVVSSGAGKQDRDLTVFDRMVGALVSGLMANGVRCYAPDALGA